MRQDRVEQDRRRPPYQNREYRLGQPRQAEGHDTPAIPFLPEHMRAEAPARLPGEDGQCGYQGEVYQFRRSWLLSGRAR